MLSSPCKSGNCQICLNLDSIYFESLLERVEHSILKGYYCMCVVKEYAGTHTKKDMLWKRTLKPSYTCHQCKQTPTCMPAFYN